MAGKRTKSKQGTRRALPVPPNTNSSDKQASRPPEEAGMKPEGEAADSSKAPAGEPAEGEADTSASSDASSSHEEQEADVKEESDTSASQHQLPSAGPSASTLSGHLGQAASSSTLQEDSTRDISRLSGLTRSNSSGSTLHVEEVDGKAQNIVVAVRIRPAKLGCTDAIWNINENTIKLSPNHPLIKARGSSSRSSEDAYTFHFDAIINPQQTTQHLYSDKVAPAVQSAMDGFNSTIFAYGQTGSGKTHTMMGNEGEPGIVHQAIHDVFTSIQADTSRTYLLRISYLEIYNETLKDLLSPDASDTPLKIRERSKPAGKPAAGGSSKSNTMIYVDPLHEEVVAQPTDVFDALDRGEANRHVGATDWNLRSSRSHCVFTLTIESVLKSQHATGSTKISQLNLIDLAGSEKMSTGAGESSERNTEGSHINKSLLALGNVIAKLSSSNQKGHIPFRDSKLTRLLQPSLGGNARVAIVCTVSADPAQAAESVSTLKFARNAKQVVTKAERGHVVNDQSALIQKYKKELDNLRSQLNNQNKAIATAEDGEELARAKEEHEKHLGQLVDQRTKAEEEIADMRQRRLQLSNDLQHLTKLLLTGREAAAENKGQFHSEDAVLQAAGPAGSSTRKAYSRRISEIGLGLSSPSPRRTSGLPLPSSHRSVSGKLDSLASARVGSVEKEAELEASIERLELQIRRKDDIIFRIEAESKSLQGRFEFLEQENHEQVAQVAELRAKVDNTAPIERQLTSVCEEKDELITKLQTVERAQDELKSELIAAQANLQSTNDEGVKVADALNSRDETISQLRADLEGLQAGLKERKAELDRVNSKSAATARLLSSLSQSRDQADARAQEASEKASTATERAECAEEALMLLQQSLIDSRLAWEKKEAQMQSDLEEAEQRTPELERANEALQREKAALEERMAGNASQLDTADQTLQLERASFEEQMSMLNHKLDGATQALQDERASFEQQMAQTSSKLASRDEELSRLREARKPSLPATRHGPSAGDLSAKLDALQTQSRGASASGGKLQAKTPVEESEKVAVLDMTISEQRQKIADLESELREASDHQQVEARSRPSTSLGHRSNMLRDSEMGNEDSRGSREEIERLNQVIDSQKVTISELQHDLHQWRQRMSSQRELIQKLQAEGLVGHVDFGTPFATPAASPVRPRTFQTPASALPSRFQNLSLGSPPVRSNSSAPSSPPETRLASPRSASPVKKREYGALSPSSNAVPSGVPPPDSPSRGARRRTIEKDLARLHDARAVERQRNALMTPRAAEAKQQRVLSGINQRVPAQKRMLDYDENLETGSNTSWFV